MKLNIDYEHAIDFEHCETLDEARNRLSRLTNILNSIIIIRHGAKKDILAACARHTGENLHKLSWDNKLVRLMELDPESRELVDLYEQADVAYRQVKNKQNQVIEDLMAIKKTMEVTPR